jgi:hypothetical protein
VRDGTETGANVAMFSKVEAAGIPIIASGGVATIRGSSSAQSTVREASRRSDHGPSPLRGNVHAAPGRICPSLKLTGSVVADTAS